MLFCNSSPTRRSQALSILIIYGAIMGINSRLGLFMSLAICCTISITRSDFVIILNNETDLELSGHCPPMVYRRYLEYQSSAAKEGQANYDILTVHDNPPMLDKTMNNLEGLRSGCPNLVQSKSV